MYTYDQPIQVTYKFPAAVLSAAAVIGEIAGPAGRSARALSIAAVVTTTLTGSTDAVVTVDSVGGVTTPPSLTIPGDTADGGIAGSTQGNTEGASELPGDELLQVSSDGGPSAGAADLYVTLGWF